VKNLIITLLSVLLLTNCATFLNTQDQRIAINTDEENTILINGEEPREHRGQYLVERDFGIKQITAKQEGYKNEYLAIGQHRRHWLYIVSWVPCGIFLLVPPLVDYGPKAYNYERSVTVGEEMKAFPKRDEDAKEIYFRKVGVKLDAQDNRHRYFSSYTDYLVNGDRSSKSSDDSEDITQDNTIFSDNLNEILKENGYIDTTRKVLKNSYLNNLYVEATIKEYTLHQIHHKQSGFFYVDLRINYEIQDYYGDSIYSQKSNVTSGQFVYKRNSDKLQSRSIDKAIKDAMEISMIEFFENEKVNSLMHDKSSLDEENAFEEITINNSGRYVSNLDEAIASSVTIKTKDGHGSGFIVGSTGHIITNYHVISDTSELRVILHDDREFELEILRISKIHDLALIKIKADSLVPFQISSAKELKIAKEIFAVGTPSGEDLSQSITRGIISGVRDIENGSKLIQTDASINGGNSGGVIIDGNGLVLGIVSSKLKGYAIEGVAFGIPAYEIGNKLKVMNDGIKLPASVF
jgi:serine protease Do